jgi:hypothetical protein
VSQPECSIDPALNQDKRGIAESDRKWPGWTVNTSAYAYAGSNPAPATTP